LNQEFFLISKKSGIPPISRKLYQTFALNTRTDMIYKMGVRFFCG